MESKFIKKEIIDINSSILSASENQYDLRTLSNKLSKKSDFTNPFGGINININLHTVANIELYIPDKTRDKLKDLIEIASKYPLQFKSILTQILTRNILYIGSECEYYGYIDIKNEYTELTKHIKSDFISINRVDPPTIPNLVTEWGKHTPQIVIISCHGTEYGLFLQDDQGKCKEYLNNNFYSFFEKRSIYTECVILSSCESKELGKQISNDGKNVICINRKVDIRTATEYTRNFFIYINNHSLENNNVYENAHKYSLEIIGFEAMTDQFAFEFIKPDKIF